MRRTRVGEISFSSFLFSNLELAFRTSEDMLGIPALLETEDLLDSEFPDQFSVMTYLAQFYHLFSGSKPRGRDSGLSSFKNSSTEEEVVRREVRTRPVSWHQPRAQPQLERDNPFRHENSEDADDEMGEQRLRRGGLTGGQQEVVQRRRRPASLHGVSSLYRQHRRSVKRKHVSIGHSDLPRPYQPRDLGLASIKRRRSEDIVTENNINNETAMRLRERRDEMIESVVKVRRMTSQGK